MLLAGLGKPALLGTASSSVRCAAARTQHALRSAPAARQAHQRVQRRQKKCVRGRLATCSASSAASAPLTSGDLDAPKSTSGSPINDVLAGATTAAVALPLALAFGVASGLGPLAGLYGSIFVGLFAAVCGGTPAQISGPTAPMTVFTAALVARYTSVGQPGLVFSVIVLAGLGQILLGFLKLGQYIQLVPRPVTSGFMTGIGLIIITTQWPAVLGHTPASSTLAAIQHAGSALANVNVQALIAGSVSLLISVCTPAALSRFVPGSLLGLAAGTLLANMKGFSVPRLGTIPSGIPIPHVPSFPLGFLPAIIASAAVLAVLGAIDSLLTSLVADSLTGDYHNSDRELLGQGLGNAMSGLFGGVAGAGATVRTVVNVRAGGRTPLSGVVHSLLLLAVCCGFSRFASVIPLACLGGLLLKCGWDVLDWSYIERIPQLPNESVAVMGLVMALTIFWDLIVAVAVGSSVMALLYVRDTAEVQLSNCNLISSESGDSAREVQELSSEERRLLRSSHGSVGIFLLESRADPGFKLCSLAIGQGSFAFGAANGLLRKVVPTLKQFDTVILDLSETDAIDDTAALAIEEMLDKAVAVGRKLYVCGATPGVMAIFQRLQMVGKMLRAPDLLRHAALEMAVAPA